MGRLDKIASKLFLYGLPVMLLLAFLSNIGKGEIFKQLPQSLDITRNLLGMVIFLTWMLITMYLSLRLLTSKEFRGKAFSRLLFLKNRDEREEYLTGKAIKPLFL